jgi:Bacillus haemolytic enterotoxin (HBL)
LVTPPGTPLYRFENWSGGSATCGALPHRTGAKRMIHHVQLPHQSKQKQLSQALVLQGYCRTVLAQQPLSLDKLGAVNNAQEIKDIAQKLDETLQRAKDHARSYLDDLQPKLITDTVALRSWIKRAEVFPDSVRSVSSEWKKGLDILIRDTTTHAQNALGTKGALEKLRDGFQQDSQDFSQLADRLNVLVSGEKGALKNLEAELGALQTKISGLIAATVLGFLAAAAGVLMMIVGTVATAFTGGASAGLVLGGFALVAAGVVGGGVSAAFLKQAYDEQRAKLEDQSRLSSAVTIMKGASANLTSIAGQGSAVVTATQEMAIAWTTLGTNLNEFKTTLTDQSLQSLRDFWCNALKGQLQTLEVDLNRNLDQLTGVQVEHTGENVYLFDHPNLIIAAAA